MNNNQDDTDYFPYHVKNANYLHPYYDLNLSRSPLKINNDSNNNEELTSTPSTNNNNNNNPTNKSTFPLKPSNVYQLFLIIIIWLISVTLLSLLIWQIILPQVTLSPIVEITSGRILGSIETRGANRRLALYHGVPYARPPLGSRRFTRPEPVLPWKGIYKATSQPASCHQFSFDSSTSSVTNKQKTSLQTFFSRFFPSTSPSSLIISSADKLHQSEDCLYLNLYVPLNDDDEHSKSKKETAKGKLKSVLVFIHGGGFMSGSINHYDPSMLAIEGDIIVVTVGYRLGLFGFIYYEINGSPSMKQGNLGLYDQSLALQWVHSNIHHFQGDPDRIVLFGDFAGSQSVGFHLISNHSQPYFTRAIMLNGSPFNLPLIMSRERALNKTRALINATGCDATVDNYDYEKASESSQSKSQISITAKKIDCLRGLKASQLIAIDRKLSRSKFMTYYPVAEESFFPIHPFEALDSGEYGPQKQLMIGYNGNYDSWMKDLGLADFIINSTSSTDYVTSKMLLNRLSSFGPQNIAKHYYEIVTQVIMEGHSSISPLTLAERINSLSLDLAIRCPAYFQITSFVQNENRSVYYFELRAVTGYELLSKIFTSLNNYNYTSSATSDIGLIFGYPLMNKKKSTTNHSYQYYSQDDVAFSKQIMNLWINFIKNGKPTTDDVWMPCTAEDKLYRYIIKRKGTKLRTGFPENQCDQYFRILYVIGKSYGKSY